MKIAVDNLRDFVIMLFRAQQTPADVAQMVSDVLVTGDLLGQHTHGVKLARGYLRDIRNGHAQFNPECLAIIKQTPVSRLYDANYLLGPQVMAITLQWAMEAALVSGIGVANIRRSHHIACLGAYLKRVTDQGLVCLIMSSDPAAASVAPFGGVRAVVSPNPLAMGVPAIPDPLLIDVSMSSITNGMVAKQRQLGKKLKAPVLLTADGRLSDNPEDAYADPPATILPLGGNTFGHKGFALALMVEVLTSGLGGFGRKDHPQGWGASVCVIVINPECFGGLSALQDEVAHLAEQIRTNPPVDPESPARMPGWGGMANWRRAQREGILLPPDAVSELQQAAVESNVQFPF